MQELTIKRFSKAANSYDQNAGMQQEIADKVIELIPKHFENGLDLGCGTGLNFAKLLTKVNHITGLDLAEGMIAEAQKRNIPNATAIYGDIEKLPFQENSFDLIFSSLALQWCDLTKAFSEIKRVATPKAFVALAFPVDGTLSELKEALAISGLGDRTAKFPDINVAEELSEKFFSLKAQEHLFQRQYSTPGDFLKAIRGVGADSPNTNAPLGKEAYKRFHNTLQKMSTQNKLIHSYRTLIISGYLNQPL